MARQLLKRTKVARVRGQGTQTMPAIVVDIQPQHLERIVGPLGPGRDIDAIRRPEPHVVDEVLSDVRAIMNDRNVVSMESTGWTDTGDHQQLRGLEGTS